MILKLSVSGPACPCQRGTQIAVIDRVMADAERFVKCLLMHTKYSLPDQTDSVLGEFMWGVKCHLIAYDGVALVWQHRTAEFSRFVKQVERSFFPSC